MVAIVIARWLVLIARQQYCNDLCSSTRRLVKHVVLAKSIKELHEVIVCVDFMY